MADAVTYEAEREQQKKFRSKLPITEVDDENTSQVEANMLRLTSDSVLTLDKVHSRFIFAKNNIIGIEIDKNKSSATIKFDSVEVAESVSHLMFNDLKIEVVSSVKNKKPTNKPVKPVDIVFAHKDDFLLSILTDTYFSKINSILFEKLKTKHAIVEHNQDNITIRCTLNTNLENYNNLAKNWSSETKKIVEKFKDEFSFVKLALDEYDGISVKKEVKAFNARHGFTVGYRMNRQQVIVFAKTDKLKEFFNGFKKEVNKKTQLVAYEIPKLQDADLYKIIQPLLDKLKVKYPDIESVVYDTEAQIIKLKGPLSIINSMTDTLAYCVSKIRSDRLKSINRDCLDCPNLVNMLEAIANEKKLFCRFKTNGELIYINDCPQIDSPAMFTLDEIDRHVSTTYTYKKIDFLKDGDDASSDAKWTEFKIENIINNQEVTYSFVETPQESYLVIFGKNDAVAKLDCKIRLFLNENKLVTRVVDMSSEDVLFVKTIECDELLRIENERKVKFNIITIPSADSNELSNLIKYEMKISNCSETVFVDVLKDLKNLITKKKTDHFEISELPGLAKVLCNPAFKHDLEKLQHESKCHISYEGTLYDYKFDPMSLDPDLDDQDNTVLRKCFGKSKLSLRKGNIVATKADVIVNSCPKNLNLKSGTLSRYILEAAGDVIQTELRTKYATDLYLNDIAITKSGNMKNCKWLYHVVCTSFNEDSPAVSCKILETIVWNCLNQMKKDNLYTIAIPAIGCGNLDFPARFAAHIITDVCCKFLNNNQDMKYHVNIVIYDDDTYQNFVNKMKVPWTTWSSIVKQSTVDDSGSRVTVKRTKAMFTVISNTALHDVSFKTKEIIDNYIRKEVIGDDNVKRLKSDKLENILKITSDVEVKRNVNGAIILYGYIDDIRDSNEKLTKLIISHYMSTTKEYQKLIRAQSNNKDKDIQWEYNRQGDEWISFSFAISSAIEDAYSNKEKSVSFINEDGDEGSIDFFSLKCTILDTLFTIRRVKAPKYELKYPDTWMWSDTESDYDLVKVEKSSNEYNSVVTDFLSKMHTLHTLTNINVIDIERIQNKRLYKSYMIHKDYLKQKNNNNENEKLLYHGTDEKNITNICVKGFNRSYAGAHATAYGHGVYFAVDSQYSHNYTGRGIRVITIRKMFRARVLVGDSILGDSSMKIAPFKNSIDQYDSTKDSKESIFVCYHDNQCYPEYLISYY